MILSASLPTECAVRGTGQLSRTSIADEMREEHRQRTLGE
jgi:hypothetical protein